MGKDAAAQAAEEMRVAQAQGNLDAERAARKRFDAVSRPEAAQARRNASGEGEHARRTPPQERQAPSREHTNGGTVARSQAIREWAAAQGYEVAPRGKLPAEVIAAYEQAHGG